MPGGAHEARPRPAGAPGGTERWRLSVLGTWRIERDDVVVAPPGGRPGSLVQLVAVSGGRIPVDAAVEHLWPGSDPTVGRVRLRNVLARVRRAVGRCVERQGEVLALAERVEVDLHEFLAHADVAIRAARSDGALARHHSEKALRVHAGPLLPAALYDPWTLAPREQARRRYVELLEIVAAHAREEGRWDDVARHLELAIEADPDDHERYVAAAQARLADGRCSRALQLCREVRDRAAELGVPPPNGIAAVEAAVTGGAAAS